MKPPQLRVVHGSLVLRVSFNVLGEPLAELVVRVKETGHDEMEKRPKLLH
jgi:hypothetical protein